MKCTYCEKICKNENSLRNHQRLCKLNPNRQESSFKKHHEEIRLGNRLSWNSGLDISDPRIANVGKAISLATKGKTGYLPSLDQKLKTSQSMKKAHSEGRAWNIGKSRWNNKKSYPEEFFTKVISNEFNDKNYVSEYSLGVFALDFAWIDKRLCIEIDGDQHQRFQEYKDRDARKDKFIADSGWKVLRIEWKKMYNDPKTWIKIANDFIG